MKNISIAMTSLLSASAIILSSCGGSGSSSQSASDPVVSDNSTSITTEDGSASARLDQDTELQTGIQGFTVDKIYIIDGNDKKISTSEVALNTSFSIVYEGVKNYTLKDGKAFPRLSIQVTDDNQVTVLSESDLLASYTEGLSEETASVLRATVTVGEPMKTGKYICSVQVVDQNNPDAGILSTWGFDVK